MQTTVDWSSHIISKPGNPVYYSLDYSSFTKTTNYDKDDRLTITEGEDTVDNLDYNPEDTAYDVWYLDGSGYWPEPQTEIETAVKERLTTKYFNDDV